MVYHNYFVAVLPFELFKEIYPWERYVRGVGVSVSTSIWAASSWICSRIYSRTRSSAAERSGDKLRTRYGNNVMQLAIVTKDPRIKKMDVKGEHTIHPYSFFKPK